MKNFLPTRVYNTLKWKTWENKENCTIIWLQLELNKFQLGVVRFNFNHHSRPGRRPMMMSNWLSLCARKFMTNSIPMQLQCATRRHLKSPIAKLIKFQASLCLTIAMSSQFSHFLIDSSAKNRSQSAISSLFNCGYQLWLSCQVEQLGLVSPDCKLDSFIHWVGRVRHLKYQFCNFMSLVFDVNHTISRFESFTLMFLIEISVRFEWKFQFSLFVHARHNIVVETFWSFFSCFVESTR